MKNILVLAAVITSISLVFGVNNSVKAQDVVVIVNKANAVGDMSAGQVKLYYLRKIKKRWPSNNLSIKPATIKGSSSAKTSFLSLLGMSNTAMAQYFSQRQFANSEAPPVDLANDAEMIRYVNENEGAIGYVSNAAYNASSSKVKAVFTK